MADLYLALKTAHVLLAIVAVGANATYGIWLARAARESAHLEHVLRGVKILDDRLANPAYGLLLVTGLSMVYVGHLSLKTTWIAAALALYVLAVALAAFGYTPTLRKQIEQLQNHGPQSREFASLAKRGTILGIVLAVDVILIVCLMVLKPTL